MKRRFEVSEEEIKRKARAIANVYQSRGLLVPQPCEKCGEAKTQKHHHDYSKPLDVHWLCWHCHAAEHGGFHRVAKFGKGACAKCDQPKVPHRSYCQKHWKEYQKDWRDNRNRKFRELQEYKRKHAFHDSGNVRNT